MKFYQQRRCPIAVIELGLYAKGIRRTLIVVGGEEEGGEVDGA